MLCALGVPDAQGTPGAKVLFLLMELLDSTGDMYVIHKVPFFLLLQYYKQLYKYTNILFSNRKCYFDSKFYLISTEDYLSP